MLTPNDKITQVEFSLNQFKAESKKVYGDLAQRSKMAEMATETLIEQIGSLKAMIEHRFDRVNMRLDAQDAHLMYLQEKTDQTDKALSELKQGQIEMKTTLDLILARLPEKP
jgi:hypothetical protein